MKPDLKKLVILNLPYLLFVYLFGKVGEAYRLAALGTGRNAKRATCIHLLFNLIGTAIFTAAVLIFPIVPMIEAAIPGARAEIAAMHVIFNLATTVLLLPFGNSLARLACLLLPDREEVQGTAGMRLSSSSP